MKSNEVKDDKFEKIWKLSKSKRQYNLRMLRMMKFDSIEILVLAQKE